MCKQIRHTYYCEELFLIKHISQSIAVKVQSYSIIPQLMWCIQFVSLTTLYNTTVLPSILGWRFKYPPGQYAQP